MQAFSDILASNEVFDADMQEVYDKLGMDAASTTKLDAYLGVRACQHAWTDRRFEACACMG